MVPPGKGDIVNATTARGHRRLLLWAVVLVIVAAAVAVAWPRATPECTTYGRAADYQSTPATIGTGVTCLR